MALQIEFETQFGAIANYIRVKLKTIDFQEEEGIVVVSGWINESAYLAGKFPVDTFKIKAIGSTREQNEDDVWLSIRFTDALGKSEQEIEDRIKRHSIMLCGEIIDLTQAESV